MTQSLPNESDPNSLEYQLIVLRYMISQLPPSIRCHFDDQFDKVVKAVGDRDNKIAQKMRDDLDDIRLSIANQKFDLDATKAERDELLARLDGFL